MAGYDHRRQRFGHRYRYGRDHLNQHRQGIRHGHRRRRTPGKSASHKKRPLNRRQVLIYAAAGVGVVVLLVALSAYRAISLARHDLAKAQAYASIGIDKPQLLLSERGRQRVANALADVHHETKHAAKSVNSSISLKVVGFLPVVGSQARGVRQLVNDLNDEAAVGQDVVHHLRKLLDGSQATAIDLPELRAAASAMAKAEATLAPLSRSGGGLVGPIHGARARFNVANDHVVGLMHDGVKVAGVVNAMLGGDGDKTYLVVGENNAEMREQGAVLSWALMHTTAGHYRVDNAASIGALSLKQPVDFPLPASTNEVFGPLQPTLIWQSTNAWADFPRSGALMADMYAAKKHEQVDGVVAVDVPTLQAILKLTGPVQVPGIDQPVSNANASAILLNRLYQQFPRGDQQERQDLIAATAQAAIDKLQGSSIDPARLAKALFAAAEGRHLLIYDANPSTQAVAAHYGVSGAVDAKPYTSFLLAAESGVAAKLDYYVRVKEQMNVRLQADGGAFVTTKVTLVNTAPKNAKPSYALGGGPGSEYSPGQYRARLYYWTPRGSFGAGSLPESGLELTPAVTTVDPSSTKTITFQTSIRKLVTDGEVRLDLLPQPRLHATKVDVTLNPGPWRVKHGALSRHAVLTKTFTPTWKVRR